MMKYKYSRTSSTSEVNKGTGKPYTETVYEWTFSISTSDIARMRKTTRKAIGILLLSLKEVSQGNSKLTLSSASDFTQLLGFSKVRDQVDATITLASLSAMDQNDQ